jgi:Pathogenicity locus
MSESRDHLTRLEQLPNVGKATAADFRLLGIHTPHQLIGRDPYQLYDRLCALTNQRHDPCVIDVFIAATRFMSGEPATPWWKYTAERKATVAARSATTASRAAKSAAHTTAR